MGKPQIAVRMPPSLMEKLNSYVEKIDTSKTDVVVSAIAQYLGGTRDLNWEVGEKFYDQVGWTQGGEWVIFNDLTYNLNASRGHLPRLALRDQNSYWFLVPLFSRCEM